MDRGFGLLEVVISVAIIILVVTGLIMVNLTSLKIISLSGQKIQAYQLANQAHEVLRYLKDNANSWDNFVNSLPSSCDPSCQLKYEGNKWHITGPSEPETIEIEGTKFEREIKIDATSPPGTDTSNYRKVTVTISWEVTARLGTQEKQIETMSYLTKVGD